MAEKVGAYMEKHGVRFLRKYVPTNVCLCIFVLNKFLFTNVRCKLNSVNCFYFLVFFFITEGFSSKCKFLINFYKFIKYLK